MKFVFKYLLLTFARFFLRSLWWIGSATFCTIGQSFRSIMVFLDFFSALFPRSFLLRTTIEYTLDCVIVFVVWYLGSTLLSRPLDYVAEECSECFNCNQCRFEDLHSEEYPWCFTICALSAHWVGRFRCNAQ